MIQIKDFMELSPSDLAEMQHKELKSHTISILENAIEDIKNENYQAHSIPVDNSPSGDGYGCHNDYINFGYGAESMDISEILFSLSRLKQIIKT